ncbi:MAG: DUF309 domain-containing protein, partial [Rhodobacteraceae bacterium]|nr:DUF309 domain-containing protein [Paracoccaceae bacterium]
QFDEIISSIPSVIDFETLQTLSAFHTALNYMQHGFQWEAHEILEAIWMNTAQNSIERLFTQCIIHLANANLKHIMKRETATQKIMTQANALSVEISLRAPNSVVHLEIQKLFLNYAL